MAKLRYFRNKPHYSTLTKQYYASFDLAFQASLRDGGGAYNDFNIYLVKPDGSVEYEF